MMRAAGENEELRIECGGMESCWGDERWKGIGNWELNWVVGSPNVGGEVEDGDGEREEGTW